MEKASFYGCKRGLWMVFKVSGHFEMVEETEFASLDAV